MKLALKHVARSLAVATISMAAVAVYAQSGQRSASPADRSDSMQREHGRAGRMADQPCDRMQDGCGPSPARATGGTASPAMEGMLRSGNGSYEGLVITPDSDLQTNRVGD